MRNDPAGYVGTSQHARYLVGITGRAGSGKTTVADRLTRSINDKLVQDDGSTGSLAKAISLDGCRATLDGFEDPIEAHRRRGSPETFDAKGYAAFVAKLVQPTVTTLEAPSFSHTLKDPVEGGIMIQPHEEIILLEGLYALFNESPDWAEASKKLDFKVLIEVSNSVSGERLVQRHLKSGICDDAEEARQRVETNDAPNSDRLMRHMITPDWVLESIEDSSMGCELP
ncbi:P-loop containing nucleoside triphosphate hydrolase protein [Melampsora americana]|nr:P-loop containing nucleoside triphosphate hydrolase protein [Melampsora americana]